MKYLSVIIAALILISCKVQPPTPNINPNAAPRYQDAVATSYTLINKAYVLAATVFAVDENTLATAAHYCLEAQELVIFKHAHIIVQTNANRVFKARVKTISNKADVCVLDAPHHGLRVLPLAPDYSTLNYGDQVLVVGSPAGIIVAQFPGQIVTSDYQGVAQQLKHLIILTAASTPGISGSPVIYNGEVVGVLVMGLPNFPHLSAAVPIRLLKELL